MIAMRELPIPEKNLFAVEFEKAGKK